MLAEHSDPLPLTGPDGSTVDLRSMAAPVTVVSMWATFCEPCVAELPELEALHRRFEDDPDVSIVTVNVDPPETRGQATTMLAELAPTIPAYFDDDGAIARWLQPPGPDGAVSIQLPLLAVVDSQAQMHVRVGYAMELSEGAQASDATAIREVIEAARRGELPPSPELPMHDSDSTMPPGDTPMLKLSEPATAEEIPKILEQVEPLVRSFGELSDEEVETMMGHIRTQLEEGRTEVIIGDPAEASAHPDVPESD